MITLKYNAETGEKTSYVKPAPGTTVLHIEEKPAKAEKIVYRLKKEEPVKAKAEKIVYRLKKEEPVKAIMPELEAAIMTLTAEEQQALLEQIKKQKGDAAQ